MLGVLDAETDGERATADADLYRILDDPTEPLYRHFLAATYHFEYAVELRLAAVVDLSTQLLARYSHAAQLLDDLLALGTDRGALEVLARPIDLPAIETVPQAFGWMYVVQRNTLHHRALYRALIPRMRSALRFASRYLTAHTSDVYERWYALGGEMDRVATGDVAAAIVGAARDAFAHEHRWYVEAWATRTLLPARLVVAR